VRKRTRERAGRGGSTEGKKENNKIEDDEMRVRGCEERVENKGTRHEERLNLPLDYSFRINIIL
jgi:hypothetical protein